jgi:hypothetical protein
MIGADCAVGAEPARGESQQATDAYPSNQLGSYKEVAA